MKHGSHGSHESLEGHAQRDRDCECDWIQTQATITLFQALGAWRPGRDSEVSQGVIGCHRLS